MQATRFCRLWKDAVAELGVNNTHSQRQHNMF